MVTLIESPSFLALRRDSDPAAVEAAQVSTSEPYACSESPEYCSFSPSPFDDSYSNASACSSPASPAKISSCPPHWARFDVAKSQDRIQHLLQRQKTTLQVCPPFGLAGQISKDH